MSIAALPSAITTEQDTRRRSHQQGYLGRVGQRVLQLQQTLCSAGIAAGAVVISFYFCPSNTNALVTHQIAQLEYSVRFASKCCNAAASAALK